MKTFADILIGLFALVTFFLLMPFLCCYEGIKHGWYEIRRITK